MRRALLIAKRILVVSVASVIVVYLCDYLLARYRMANPKTRNALGYVKIQRTYVIPHKDGKAEFVFGEPETQVCVHSLFPHSGYNPCWYVTRGNLKPIPMDMLWLR
jgi:hypothetical protein